MNAFFLATSQPFCAHHLDIFPGEFSQSRRFFCNYITHACFSEKNRHLHHAWLLLQLLIVVRLAKSCPLCALGSLASFCFCFGWNSFNFPHLDCELITSSHSGNIFPAKEDVSTYNPLMDVCFHLLFSLLLIKFHEHCFKMNLLAKCLVACFTYEKMESIITSCWHC